MKSIEDLKRQISIVKEREQNARKLNRNIDEHIATIRALEWVLYEDMMFEPHEYL